MATAEPSRSASPVRQSTPPAPGAESPLAGCAVAPAWLVDAISAGILVRGAYLSHAYVGPASGFTSGPPELFTDAFAGAWWLAARLNGAGVEPELVVFVTNRTAQDIGGQIDAVNPAARRYTEWGAGISEPIAGEGLADVQACVGAIPGT